MSVKPVVDWADPRSHAAETLAPSVFGVPGTGRVASESELTDDPTAVALAHRVAKQPDDARVHVERINHHLGAEDPEGTYGALVDLFIAFGPEAAGLRRRMLGGSRRLLEPEWFDALEAAQAEGLAATQPMRPALWSVLSAGVCGQPVVVCEHGVDPAEGTSGAGSAAAGSVAEPAVEPLPGLDTERVLAEARGCVRRGLFGDALELLEYAVLDEPHNAMLIAALCDLYRVVGDGPRVSEMVDLMTTATAPPSPLWAQLAEEFQL